MEISSKNIFMDCCVWIEFLTQPVALKISVNSYELDIPKPEIPITFYRFKIEEDSIKNCNCEIKAEFDDMKEGVVYCREYVRDGYRVSVFVSIHKKESKKECKKDCKKEYKKEYNQEELELEKIRIIGHRGCGEAKYSPEYQENSIESFLKAHERGAQMVELDIHLVDGKLVIYHDGSINGRYLNSMEYEECSKALKEMKIAAITLSDVLSRIPGTLSVDVELKSDGYDSGRISRGIYYANMVNRLMEIHQKHPEKRLFYSSFDPLLCAILKLAGTKNKVGLLINSEIVEKIGEENAMAFLSVFDRSAGPDAYILDTDFYETTKISALVKGFGKRLFCYGPSTNTKEGSEKLFEYGFDGVCTDNLSIYQLE